MNMRAPFSLSLGSALMLAALAGCNAPPVAPVVQINPEGPTTLDQLELEFLTRSEDPDGGDVVSYEIRWLRDGVELDELDDELMVRARLTAKDQEWRVVVTPFDSRGREGQAGEASTVIQNTPPSGAEVTISPPIPVPNEALTAVPIAQDVDGDSITWTYRWFKDDELTEHIGVMLPEGLTSKGDVWSVEATPNDGDDDGEPATASVSIDNSAPEVVSITIEPVEAFTTTDLTAVPEGFDEDGDTITWSYRWFRNDTEIGGAVTDELASTNFVKGDDIVVEVTPNDGFVDGAPERSLPLRILNTPPTFTAAAIEPDVAFTNTVLECVGVGFEDIDDDPPGYRYRWFVNGIEASSERFLPTPLFQKDDEVFCEATAFDGQDTGNTEQSDSIFIRNSPPSIEEVVINVEEPTSLDTLGVSIIGLVDPDGDDVVLEYRWYTLDDSDEQVVLGTDPELTSDEFEKNTVIWVEVTPDDLFNRGEPVVSEPVTIRNSEPEITEFTIEPELPFAFDDIVATVETFDADGDEVIVTYTWTVNDDVIGSAEGRTLDSMHFVKGDVVRLSVLPSDDESDGEELFSPFLIVQNSLPEISDVALNESELFAETSVTCIPLGWSDADGDSPGYRYRWLADGEVVATTATLQGSFAPRDIDIRCEVTPYDGEDFGDALLSDPIQRANTAPVIGGVSLSSLSPREGETLSLTFEGVFDADGDEVELNIAWFVDGSVVSGQTSDLLSSEFFQKGDEVYAIVTPVDSFGLEGDSAQSVSGFVANTPPVMESVVLDNLSPSATETITATAVASDIDQRDVDAGLRFTYTWLVDGDVARVDSDTTSTTSSFVGMTDFRKNQNIRVRVQVSDGDAQSGTLVSSSANSVNTPPRIDAASISPSADVLADTTLRCNTSGWSDPDQVVAEGIDLERYRYRWRINGSSAGTSQTLTSGIRRDDVVTCTATPFDDEVDGEPRTSTEVTVGNSVPTLGSVSLSSTSPRTTEVLVATPVDAHDPDGDPITFSYEWNVNGSPEGGGPSLDLSAYSPGAQVFVTVTPSDDAGGTGEPVESALVTIQNSPPRILSIDLSPDSPLTLDPIVATVEADDPDGGTPSLSYAWSVNGSPAGGNSPTLPANQTRKGDTVTVTVTATDDDEGTDSQTSATLEVGNTLPVISGVTLNPDSFDTTESNLTCEVASWDDPDVDDIREYRFVWTVGDEPLPEVITTDPSDSLDPGFFVRGNEVFCSVTPFDGDDVGATVSSEPSIVENYVPELESVSIDPPTANSTTTLSAVIDGLFDADEADGDPLTVNYVWRDLTSDVVLSTASTVSSGLVAGHTVQVEVFASDGIAQSPTQTASVTIQNSPPVFSDVFIGPVSPQALDTLVSNVTASDPDGESFSLSYEWQVNGGSGWQTVTGQTGSTLTNPAAPAEPYFRRSQDIRVRVTGTSSPSGATSEQFSNVVQAINTPPTLGSARVRPSGGAGVNGTFTCEAVSPFDADDDPVIMEYRWFVGSSEVPGATSSSLSNPAGNFQRDDLIRCEITPFDNIERGTPRLSSAVPVGNTAPSLTTAVLTRADGEDLEDLTTLDDLRCTASGWSDPDSGDTREYRFHWEITRGTGTLLLTEDIVSTDSEVEAILSSEDIRRDDEIACFVVPFDGFDEGAPAVAVDEPVVQNTPPQIDRVEISNLAPRTTEAITCTAMGWDDPDDEDDRTWNFVWTITPPSGEGSPFTIMDSYEDPTGTESSASVELASSNFFKGDLISCEVTPEDRDETGDEVDSDDDATVANTPPTTGVANVTGTFSANQDLTCTLTGDWGDIDQTEGRDETFFRYQWSVDDDWLSGTDSAIFNDTSPNDRVRCRAWIRDQDEAEVGPVASPEIQIGNAPPVISSVTFSAEIRTLDTPEVTVMATDPDGPNNQMEYAYVWRVGSDVVRDVSELVNTTSDMLSDNTLFVRDNELCVTVSVTDRDGATTEADPVCRIIQNTPPSGGAAAVASVDDNGIDRDTVCTASGFTDPDVTDGNQTLEYRYEWSGTATRDSGWTTSLTDTLPANSASAGDVTCTITARDFEGATETASALGTLGLLDLTPTLVEASPGTFAGQTLFTNTDAAVTVEAGNAAGGSFTYTYNWSVVDGFSASPSGSDPSSTFDSGNFVRENQVCLTATVNNTFRTSSTLDLGCVTVQNSPPDASAATVTVTSADAPHNGIDHPVTCSISGATDPDIPAGDSLEYRFTWSSDPAGLNVQTAWGSSPSAELSADSVSADAQVTCTVAVRDDTDTLAPTQPSASVDLVDLTPTLVEASPGAFVAQELFTNGVASVSVAATNSQGENFTYSYTWTVNPGETEVTSSNETSDATDTSTLAGEDNFARDDEVCVTVTVDNTLRTSDAVGPLCVTINNSAPTSPGIALLPTDPEPEAQITCSVTDESTDADEDLFDYIFAWYLGDDPATRVLVFTEILEEEDDPLESVYPPAGDVCGDEGDEVCDVLASGDTWTCVVTADDGDDASEAVEDSVVVTEPDP
ncbi:MAG: hypothetical protein EA397_07610 [Deltaproteobacteria bacterium]|nr:MAG: hypothetical protein EA397_07610 [Deltaproteobacteria bacterium]